MNWFLNYKKMNKVLAEKIANRDTELQRWYDISCEREQELILEIEKQIIVLEKLRLELKSTRIIIDRCIERESQLGLDVL